MLKTHNVVSSRLQFLEVPPGKPDQSFAEAVRKGLSGSPKTLPSRFFYDEAGSHLFERIMMLPEYYLTRTEQDILERFASEMVAWGQKRISLVEFGSGNSCKTRLLIEAASEFQSHLTYVPIDISSEFLQASALTLLSDYPQLSVHAVAGEYFDAIPHVPLTPEPRLFLFMGSNIGNFEEQEALEFLSAISKHLRPEDRLLLGVDMVKDRKVIEAAYNDSAGVTAAFNRNLLLRINTSLGGNFDLDRFEHSAPFVEERSQVEMRLVSTVDQAVQIDALAETFSFKAGEYIHTENSHKYSPESLHALCGAAELQIENKWTDDQDWFAVFRLRRA